MLPGDGRGGSWCLCVYKLTLLERYMQQSKWAATADCECQEPYEVYIWRDEQEVARPKDTKLNWWRKTKIRFIPVPCFYCPNPG